MNSLLKTGVLAGTCIALLLSSCNRKEQPDAVVVPKSALEPRLRFSDSEGFKEAINLINRSPDKNQASLEISRQYATGNGFASLADHKKSLSQSAASGRTTEEKNAMEEDSLDELVPDPGFASILNKNLKVQVGGLIYKVTRHGTFYCVEGKLEQLNEILKDYKPAVSDKKIADYLYEVDSEIFRYDTFTEATDNSTAATKTTNGRRSASGRTMRCNIAGQPIVCPRPPGCKPLWDGTTYLPWLDPCNLFLPDDVYCQFSTSTYGANTIVGKGIENMFGRNDGVEENFDRNHRIKVKLYNFNYLVYSSIGIKVKFQKRGWTGIWYKQNCEKLAVGWDALIFEIPVAYPKPTGVQEFPGKTFVKEVIRFPDFNIDVDALTYLDDRILGKSVYNNKDISDALNNLAQEQLGDLTKKIWNFAEKTLDPQGVQSRESATKAFRYFFPDKFVMALSRWETTNNNQDVIDLQLDFNTIQVSYSGNGQQFDAWSNFIQPSLDKKAKSYTIKKASVYGAGKHSGAWKGIRVVKE